MNISFGDKGEKSSCDKLRLHQKIHLMRDVNQLAALDLCASFRQPIRKSVRIQVFMSRQQLLKEMQNEMQKIFFISRILFIDCMHNPIRCARRENLCAFRMQMRKQMSSSSAITTGLGTYPLTHDTAVQSSHPARHQSSARRLSCRQN